MLWEECRDEEWRWERWLAEGGGTSMMAGLDVEGVWMAVWGWGK
jgi:hypothetical protein